MDEKLKEVIDAILHNQAEITDMLSIIDSDNKCLEEIGGLQNDIYELRDKLKDV